MTARRRGLLAAAGVVAAAALTLTACSSGNPLDSSSKGASNGSSGSSTVIVGSAAFPENEIIAEVYAQALQAAGVKVKTQLSIGQRDVYLAALKDGSIDLIPEYSGNLMQYYDADSSAQTSDDVYAALNDALPKGFEVLDQAKAQDRDSYNVTKEFSEKYGVTSLADLKKVDIPLTVGANAEFKTRPYGIPGLKKVYGVDATLKPISDSGGPITVGALEDGTVQLADIFTTTPSIKQFVTLKDPEHLIIAQNVVPLINSKKASEKVRTVLNKVQAKLTTDDLISFNEKSSGDAKESSADIAKQWLSAKGLD
ncbi:ABC transporter substrate-binding protein [Microbacterium sp. STN6]|uniref:ABC transporter substrate-binding protein n=1 Tax=Microbacterium sp. STN6 TaxID=2995588 RepID=UPI002260C904|nr:ABC transporter substrate-binding protein [Microbacterium sp. STN6]MCX7522288.1 ABC transporter substrate-binding protein [Microbacterium sp. STN6]